MLGFKRGATWARLSTCGATRRPYQNVPVCVDEQTELRGGTRHGVQVFVAVDWSRAPAGLGSAVWIARAHYIADVIDEHAKGG
jgi:hypothetical protein